VYEGEINCSDLEEVYRMFNLNHPEGYHGRSLSVSDVVEVIDPPKIVGVVEIPGVGERNFTDFLEYTSFQETLRQQDTDYKV